MALAARAGQDSLLAAATAPVDSTVVVLSPDPPAADRPTSRLASENSKGLPRPFTMKKPMRGASPRTSRPSPAKPAAPDTTRPGGSGNRGRQLEAAWH